MPSNEQHYLEIFRILETESRVNQRKLAQELNVSLGKLNYCLNALIKKGWVKAANFKNSRHKLAYAYQKGWVTYPYPCWH